MIDILTWIVGSVFLGMVSVIDIKTFNKDQGHIPSVLTTLFLIVAFTINFPNSLFSGVFGGLIALLLTDIEYWGGLADFKVFTAAAMLFGNIVQVSIFAGIVTVVGLVYKLFMRRYLRTSEGKVPFIPAIFIGYIVSFIFFLVLL